MPDDDILLRIEGLKTYFHTYEGVVRALEGIDLDVRRGETMGLVGETGCGKSVTALSVMRLIPSPPGKIEAGKVFLDEPPSVTAFRREYDNRFENAQAEARKKELQSIERDLGSLKTGSSEARRKELKDRIAALTYSYDLLGKSSAEMNALRGDWMSMIFQEPMTALNPAYTIGDQISETVEIHQMDKLVDTVLKQLELERSASKAGKKTRREPKKDDRRAADDDDETSKKGEVLDGGVCSSCGADARDDWGACTGCGARFVSRIPAILYRQRLRIASSYYRRIKESPDNTWAYLVRSNPITRRLQRRLRLAKMVWAEQALREVKIAEPRMVVRNYPHELSGGMRQRAMIAMMMACQPDLLIADEPTTALDVTVEAQILDLMKELQDTRGTSILLITHDLGIIAETCRRVAIMYAGYIVELATTEEIFARPMHPYTNALLKSIPKIGLKYMSERKKPLYVIPGVVPNLLTPPPGCRFHPRCERALDICKSEVPALRELAPGHFVECHNPVMTESGVSPR
jgi:peptide/nickel transport system ATP-binding protein